MQKVAAERKWRDFYRRRDLVHVPYRIYRWPARLERNTVPLYWPPFHQAYYPIQVRIPTADVPHLKRNKGLSKQFCIESKPANSPISLLHVPSMMRSSRRNMWRPGKPLAQPRPVRSRKTDAWLYGLYSYAWVPFPALKPICRSEFQWNFLRME